MNDNIVIKDWLGKTLFEGNYKHISVDKVLQANKCPHCESCNALDVACLECDDTGYIGDFYVAWEDAERNDNVYEYINY